MIALFAHIYPEDGAACLRGVHHDLEQPLHYALEDCDACKAGKCVQTTIVSKNFRDTIVVHALTSAPMIQVPLDLPGMQELEMRLKDVPDPEAVEKAVFGTIINDHTRGQE